MITRKQWADFCFRREHHRAHYDARGTSWELIDSRGIYCGRVCSECEELKRGEFAPGIFGTLAAHDCQEGACEGDADDKGPCSYHRMVHGPVAFLDALAMLDNVVPLAGDDALIVFERFEHRDPTSRMGWLVRFAGMIPRIRDALRGKPL